MKNFILLLVVLFNSISFAGEEQLTNLRQGTEKYLYIFEGRYNQPTIDQKTTSKSKVKNRLCGFMTQNANIYINPKYSLDFRTFLNGNIEAWGVACDYSKNLREHFYINKIASWDGNNGTMAEKMFYASGKEESRVWNYEFQDSNNFKATGTNVVKFAKGIQQNNMVNLKYNFSVPYGLITMHLSMDDNWYMIDTDTVINRIFMKKFGIKVGEVIIVLTKKEAPKRQRQGKSAK